MIPIVCVIFAFLLWDTGGNPPTGFLGRTPKSAAMQASRSNYRAVCISIAVTLTTAASQCRRCIH